MKILIATGGTGGHVFPALRVAERLRERGWEAVFIGALSRSQAKLEASGFAVIDMPVKGLVDQGGLKFLSAVWLMTKSFFRAAAVLKEQRPDIVLGFGGYSSFPVVTTARLFRYPTMIHEQNAVPGKANQVLGWVAQRIAISFKETAYHFNRKKTVWTGCPCHDRKPQTPRAEIYERFGLKPGVTTLLVLGGSQGSQKVNEVVFNTVPRLNNVQIIHMTGAKEYDAYLEKYKDSNVVVRPFIDNIEEAYTIADLVIGRAGAATVCELAAFAIPSILIPYPFANSHQKENARVLESLHMSCVIEQKNLTPESLEGAIVSMLTNPNLKTKLKPALEENFLVNADQMLAGAVIALSHNRKP